MAATASDMRRKEFQEKKRSEYENREKNMVRL